VELTVGLLRYLSAQTSITSRVGAFVRTPSTGEPYIFRGQLAIPIENSGESAIVIRQAGSWATSNRHNTMRFPRIELQVFSDVPRLVSVGPTSLDSQKPCLELCTELFKLLHRPDASGFYWDSVRILNSMVLSEPDPRPHPDGDAMSVGVMSVGVSLG
jgi:hypothetical protein